MILSKKYERQIKESFDKLSTGILYAKPSGLIVLTNKKMYQIYNEITGEVLQSAYAFWESITNPSDKIKIIEDGDSPSVQINDEMVYNFTMKTIKISGEKYIEIKAIDVSELHKLTLDLLEKNEREKELRRKMIEIKENLELITNEEEMLDAKFKIHNTMGTGLASLRRYLTTGEGDIDKSINTWRKSLELLNKGDDFFKIEKFKSLIQASDSVGIHLKIIGKWPKKAELSKVIILVSRECLINAAIHAQAEEMIIEIEESLYDYTISFKNDGVKPKKEIKYGGGFAAIRSALQEVNGELEINVDEFFVLSIKIPKWE